MGHLIVLLLVVVGLVIVVTVMSAAMKRQSVVGDGSADAPAQEDAPAATDFDGYYRRKFLFSPAEFSFFKVLQMAVGGEYAIQVKVRIADLIEVHRGCSHHQRKVNYITRKHLDFVLCEPKTMVPMLAIELDDRSHQAADRQKRDAFVNGLLAAVGMPMLRVPAARGYEVQEIKVMVEKALAAKAA